MTDVTMFITLGAGVVALFCLGILAVWLHDQVVNAPTHKSRNWLSVLFWSYMGAAFYCGYIIVCAVNDTLSGGHIV
jgi:hypothetical protein